MHFVDRHREKIRQSPMSSRLLWAVSRDFALGNRAVDQYLDGIFTDYYDRVIDAMEIAR